jgi:hypothetical protein
LHRPAARFDSRRPGGWRSCYLSAVWARAVGSGGVRCRRGWGGHSRCRGQRGRRGRPRMSSVCRGRWGRHRRSHGDHDVGGADGFVGPGFGELVGDVDASLSHSGDGGGVDSCPGSDPPDQATAWSPVRASKNPRAIWDRPALWVHKNRTVGLPSRCGLTLWRQLGGIGSRHRRRAPLSIQLSDDGCQLQTDHHGGDLAASPGSGQHASPARLLILPARRSGLLSSGVERCAARCGARPCGNPSSFYLQSS